MPIERIVSGGQTGVDRAALDVALKLGIPCGGWCPKGRRAEDGPIEDRYPLQETHEFDYSVRTERNVADSDGTLILSRTKPTGGTALTITCAKKMDKPCLVYFVAGKLPGIQSVDDICDWCKANDVAVLNVAGPRESQSPGIYEAAANFLQELLCS